MPYSEDELLYLDENGKRIVSHWVVCFSGTFGKKGRRVVNILDVFTGDDAERKARNFAASARRSRGFKVAKVRNDGKIHVRPNYVSDFSQSAADYVDRRRGNDDVD